MNRLFLLDAMALIYRAYYAMANNQRMTSKGFNTSASFGFINYLYDLLQKEKPTHIAVCIDSIVPTFRHEEFEAYKANREKMPEDIATNIPYIKRIVSAFNIQLIECPGYEADDLIGTIAKKASKLGSYEIFIVTPDKDLGQIVDDNIRIYKPSKGKNPHEILDRQAVCEKFGVPDTKFVIDYLGLVGDSSDNIPGVSGVGPVAAKKLINEFGTIENIIQNIPNIKNLSLKNKMENGIDNALLSKRLATICTDVSCNHDIDSFAISYPNVEQIKQICSELELRMFEKRFITDISTNSLYTTNNQRDAQDITFNFEAIPGTLFSQEIMQDLEVSKYEDYKTTPHEYTIVRNDDEIDNLITLLKEKKIFSFDTETTGLNANDCEIVGFSFSVEPHKAFFVTCPDNYDISRDIIHKFTHIFADETNLIIGQNIKFDLLVLKLYGIEVKAKLFDTMIAHYLINPESQHNLNYLSETYLNYTPITIETLIGKKGMGQGNMRYVEEDILKEYAAEDADITFQLYQIFDKEISDSKNKELFEKIEMPLVKVLTSMEHEGIRIDKGFLKEYQLQIFDVLKEMENDIYNYAGQTFNINSPKQLGQILFEELHLSNKPKKTKSGQYSTGEEILTKLLYTHPIIESILNYRSMSKLLSGYIEPLPSMINKRTDKLHTNFNQAVVATGRLSSNNPNLQNIPIRTEEGREIRKAFIPSNDDRIIISADYSQIELRLIAHISKDTTMQQAFNNELDIHTATAAEIFGISLEEVDSDMRRMAKTVNFGIIYGMSPFGLSERLHISRSRATFLIEQYFLRYPGIKQYMTDIVNFAKQNGYVETIMGRRRYIKDINSANANIRGYAERNAINAPIQGSSADMIKIAMINIQDKIEEIGLKSRMVIQVHDELVFDAFRDEEEVLKNLIIKEMTDAIKLDVPVKVSIGEGKNWLEAH